MIEDAIGKYGVFYKDGISIFASKQQPESSELDMNTIDDRVQSLLCNTTALHFFRRFCTNEFTVQNILLWIEIEVFKTIKLEHVLNIFAKHIFLTYIVPNSPLMVNVDKTFKIELMKQLNANASAQMFGSLQLFTFWLIKTSYVKFEKSYLFKELTLLKSTSKYLLITRHA
jgi:hypothetical protein